MAKKSNRFSKIDDLLPITTKGKGKEKTRKIATDKTITDKLATQMAECQLPSEIALLASKFGFEDKDIIQWAKDAPNFGMFRMRVGNRARGVMSRLAKAKKEGRTLTVKEAAYAKRTRTATKATVKKATAKKATAKKATKKKTAKKATAKKATKNKKVVAKKARAKKATAKKAVTKKKVKRSNRVD